jgi:hypothetical protein
MANSWVIFSPHDAHQWVAEMIILVKVVVVRVTSIRAFETLTADCWIIGKVLRKIRF